MESQKQSVYMVYELNLNVNLNFKCRISEIYDYESYFYVKVLIF